MHEQIIMVDGQEQPISRTYQYRKVIVNLQIKFSIFKLQKKTKRIVLLNWNKAIKEI